MGFQQRLLLRFASSQGIDFHLAFREVELDTHQSVDPSGCGFVGVAQHRDFAPFVGASHEVDHAFQGSLQVESPGLGERPATWSRFDPRCRTLVTGVDELPRLSFHATDLREVKALPDLGLPAAVEALDLGLESRFARRREDGRHPQR